MRKISALVGIALLLTACTGSSDSPRVPLGAGGTSAAPAVGGQSGAVAMGGSADADVVTGTLLEQVAAPPYVYLRIRTATGEVWAAVNQATLEIGSTVTVYNALLMERFESKTLGRTFDRIYFGALEAPDAAGTSTGTPPAVDAKVGKVAKATGATARTIAELWNEKDALANKPVTIRGVVVKYNPGVMGKNWIHLQDGSGDAAKSTHDIAVTTLDSTAMGATITITGTVRLNRDMGAGYTYAVIVEDAKVARP